MAPSRQLSAPSRPVRSARRHVQSYHEDTTSESSAGTSADEQPAPPRSSRRRHEVSRDTAAAARPRRSTRAPASYREPSTDEDLDRVVSRFPQVLTNSAASQRADVLPHRPPPRKSRTGNSSKQRRSTRDSPRKRRKVEPQPAEESNMVPSGPIPPWHTLPYHILFNIFLRASYPLVDDRQAIPLPSAKWLLDVALLCRAFAEPALAALYHTPVLIPAWKAHSLVQLLSQPPESLAINYASKVQELLVDVRSVLTYKTGRWGYFDLSKLIERVPHIKTLRLYHRHDGVAPLMLSNHTSRWTYRDSIFDTLKQCNVRLHAFDWNARFMEPSNLVEMMQSRHREAPFQNLRDVRLFQIPSDERMAETEQELEELTETRLAAALKELPELRRLSFTDCTAVNEVLLPRLPTTLTSLTIDNCDEITSHNFAPFLSSHGSHLRELVLKHNRHLNLSFIVGLAESCPNLERLSVDFIMHNWPPYYNGTPHFENLLKPGEVPTWPKALQEIEMLQLRNWDKARAAAFFASLVESAPDLKDLRRIVMTATVQMGWQDRASFRKRWIRKIERTFLRKDETPAAVEAGPADGAAATPVKRQSARIAQQRLSGMDADSDESKTGSTPSDGETSDEDDDKDMNVQGMCDVVQLRIDNLRPADTQFNEDDFVDSEVSGDEEWNGVDSEPDDSYAW
ncbi:hypothetical protein VTN77DRAFT_1505 [Rasamsonia byssochlamydoides]|uniref:uncharacterized protein n=1 Tax=Rasamsonia byssochlamydoides TaxID=89139 RepID=UPI003743457B